MKVIAVEGNTQKLDGGAMFGNAPRELWKQWLAPDDKNRIHLSCRALLIQTDDGQNILWDAGIGAFFEPKLKERYGVVEEEHLLLKNLNALGIREEDVTSVILSHLHFDHAGGLLSAHHEGVHKLLFPKATYFVGSEHWKRAKVPHLRDKTSFIPRLQQLLEDSRRLVFIDRTIPPQLKIPGFLKVSQGHTIGLLILILDLPSGLLACVTDLVPGVPWLHLPITMGYDRFPELLVDEKEMLLEEIAKKEGMLFLTHDPSLPFIKVKKDSIGKYTGEKISL